ncbi:aspartate aminotransferase family protein [Halobellus clavatus]|uniref:Diaminobutyrate aminotransferase apoenzyme n=1 Tax=Halobellus clavatus TaxID=660517 RepID=A0A1H3IE27_9EURY|nr:aspartate aminotransferase family protein [Halobellus clavatus]SDY25519.1 diaminobutyrate aminotransferase apoenzyme [Halobellus clavatus]
MPDGPPPEELHLSQRPAVTEPIPGPRSSDLLERQAASEANTVAYPLSLPVAIDSARGATIKDVDGNVFLDFSAGIGVANVGHSNPYVVEAAKEQLDAVAHTIDFPTEARLAFIDALDSIAPGTLPGNSRIAFGGPTGTNAIEASIKLAKYNTGRSGIVGFDRGYHGGTMGALSLSGWSSYKSDYTPLLPDVAHVPYPTPRDGETPDAALEATLEEVRAVVSGRASGLDEPPAGIWVEPIQGSGGVIVPPEGFLAELAEITAAHDVLLIVDEIQTGMGRTGEWFASDHAGITPDAMTVGKAIGGVGLPLSATVYREELDTWGPSAHAGTFRGHVPAMVAGTRAIEYIDEYDLLDRATRVGSYLQDRFREMQQDCPSLVDVRGRGLLIGAEFRDADGSPLPDVVESIQTRCLRRGLVVWTAGIEGHVLRLLPPLVLTDEQARVGMDIVQDVVETVTEETADGR